MLFETHMTSLVTDFLFVCLIFFFSEYGGKWKILHYYAKNFFAPILASGMVENNQINVYVITDVQDLQGCRLRINIHKWDTLDKPARTITTQQFNQVRRSMYHLLIIKSIYW